MKEEFEKVIAALEKAGLRIIFDDGVSNIRGGTGVSPGRLENPFFIHVTDHQNIWKLEHPLRQNHNNTQSFENWEDMVEELVTKLVVEG